MVFIIGFQQILSYHPGTVDDNYGGICQSAFQNII